MEYVVPAIIVVWSVLLGSAYLSRIIAGFGKRSSVLAVTAGYAALSLLAVAWLGFNRAGLLGAFGMLLPYAAAIGVVMISPPNPRRAKE